MPWLFNFSVLLPAGLLVLILVAFVGLVLRDRRVRRTIRSLVLAASGAAGVHDAYLLPGADAQAFCVPGRHPLVVLTSPTVDLLSSREIAAVLDHEREHLARRHALQIICAEAVAQTIGRMGLLRHYAAQTCGLAELAADDAAARRHGRRVVATALLVMSIRRRPRVATCLHWRTATRSNGCAASSSGRLDADAASPDVPYRAAGDRARSGSLRAASRRPVVGALTDHASPSRPGEVPTLARPQGASSPVGLRPSPRVCRVSVERWRRRVLSGLGVV